MINVNVSKHLLTIRRATDVLMADIILYGVVAVLFMLVSTSSAIIGAGFTAALVFCRRNVKAGKSGGFNWAGIINGMLGFASLWYLWLVRDGATGTLAAIVAVVVGISAFFVVVFLKAMKAHMGISEKIDIAKTLEAFAEDRAQQKADGTYDGNAFRESLKDGSFEMALIYKEESDEAY